MKLLLTILGLVFVVSCGGGSTSADSDDPLVGKWLFQQLTIAHPDSQTYADRPMLCVGEITVKNDNTYTATTRCKLVNQKEFYVTTFGDTWNKVGQQQYKANGLDYDLFIDKDGKTGMYSSMANDKEVMVGLYEIGWMYKM